MTIATATPTKARPAAVYTAWARRSQDDQWRMVARGLTLAGVEQNLADITGEICIMPPGSRYEPSAQGKPITPPTGGPAMSALGSACDRLIALIKKLQMATGVLTDDSKLSFLCASLDICEKRARELVEAVDAAMAKVKGE